jgi:uncharacterized protein
VFGSDKKERKNIMKRILVAIVCISVLLISCAEPDSKMTSPSKEVTPKNISLQNDKLIQAAKDGKLLDVQTALSNGADVNAKDENGISSLFLASFNGHTEVVKLLLENGTDVNVKGTDGATALLIASLQGHK